MKVAYSAPANLNIWNQYAIPLATCWRVQRTDGTTFHFTDFDMPLQVTVLLSGTNNFETATYSPSTGYTRSAIQSNFNLSPDNADIDGLLDSTAITDVDLRAGKYENADIRVYAIEWDPPSPELETSPYLATQVMYLKRGWLGKVILQEHFYKAEWRGMIQALQTTIGKLFSPTCRATLGDSQCTVNLQSLAQAHVPVTSVQVTAAAQNASQIIGISGEEQLFVYHGTSGDINIYDNGYISVTIGGRNYQAKYNQFDTPSSIAATLTSLINADSGAVVTASSLGPSVTVTSKQPGAQFQYQISYFTSWNHWFIPDSIPATMEFPMPSFTANVTSNILQGGASAIANSQNFGVTLALPPNSTAPDGSGYYDGGLITWESGLNAGASMEVKTYTPSSSGGGSVPAWQTAHSYALNAFILDTNGNVQLMTVSGGVTGVLQPIWATALGATTTETGSGVTAVWQCLGPIGQWAALTVFPFSSCVVDTNGNLQYQYTPQFTSGPSAPAWSNTTGGVTLDNGLAHWLNLGSLGGVNYTSLPTLSASYGSGVAWGTPGNALTSSGYATLSLGAGQSSQNLFVTGTVLGVATGITPSGVEVTVNRQILPESPTAQVFASLTYQGALIGTPKLVTGETPTGVLVPTLLPGTVATFYPHNHAWAGTFEYNFPGDGYGTSLPGSVASYSLTGNQSIQFNTFPNTYLPGFGNTRGNSLAPLQVLGVTAGGQWDQTLTPMPSAGAGQNFCMIVVGSIYVPVAGNIEFVLSHDDGALIGFGNGATYVAGIMTNTNTGTKTALHGYTNMMANNESGSNQDKFTINCPAPGIYPFEINYCQWEGEKNLVLDLITTLNPQPVVPAGPTSTFVDTMLGGPGDNWGATLTQAIVNDPSFGVVFYASVAGGGTPITVQLNGVSFEVLGLAAGQISETGVLTLYLPMTYEVQQGDLFTIYPGCDKQNTTCAAKFNNIVNFRGEPFIPGVDSISQTGTQVAPA